MPTKSDRHEKLEVFSTWTLLTSLYARDNIESNTHKTLKAVAVTTKLNKKFSSVCCVCHMLRPVNHCFFLFWMLVVKLSPLAGCHPENVMCCVIFTVTVFVCTFQFNKQKLSHFLTRMTNALKLSANLSVLQMKPMIVVVTH